MDKLEGDPHGQVPTWMFERFGSRARVVAGGTSLVFCGGPIMIIFGIISCVTAIQDPRGKLVAQYKTAVAQWQTASGSAALQAAFPAAPSIALLFPAAPIASRPSNFNTTVILATQNSITPLLDGYTSNYPTTYPGALWYQGTSTSWPTSYDSSAPNTMLASLAFAPTVAPVAVQLWKCKDTAQPPGCVVSSSTGRRRLLNSAPTCTSFTRDLSTLSAVALVANGVNTGGSLGTPVSSLGVDVCSTQYTLVSSLPSA
jgi:hypothetical protein